jgi:hypothetical protein
MNYQAMVEVILNGGLLGFISLQIYQMNGKLSSLMVTADYHKERIDTNSHNIKTLSDELYTIRRAGVALENTPN